MSRVIARVTLEIALGKEFDYLIAPEQEATVEIGTRVKVPFGHREVIGTVTALADRSEAPHLKPIAKILGTTGLVTAKVLRLARWIADYYCCPAEVALKSVLPEAVRKEDARWRERLTVRLLQETAADLTARQKAVVDILRRRGDILLSELLEEAATTSQTVRRLEDKGILSISSEISERDPYAREEILPSASLELNAEQQLALTQIKAALDHPNGAANFLLHGVTGSGKTEVYLQAIDHVLKQGAGAIVLVPEISLTPQTVERFKSRFSGGVTKTLVAVLHSHLSAGERHDEWHKIRQGRARIVIGARSAIFAPVEPLRLIIVDEEHEHSYKQEESPRYNARDVAVVRGQMEGATVVLGSATPSLESFFNVQKGKYRLLEMTVRADARKLPLVRVIDMRQATRQEKGTPIFSPQLKEAMTQRLEKKEQTILFLNRRGFATSLQCPLCGFVAQCPNCSLSLTYHRAAQELRCHICDFKDQAPAKCPNPGCKNPAIRYAGLGTEKVESTLGKLFPKAVIRRMDSDTLKKKEDYRRVLGDFKRGKIDILVGTQMIAKGLHFPNVTLVGIVYADLSLHIPDFRAGERTFQLLTQVAGRAGRGEVEGEVYVQAFTPFHPAIQYARRHDFAGFFEQELEFRKQLNYPPYSRIALITLRGTNEEKVEFASAHVKRELEKHLGQEMSLAGPAPAPLAKAQTYYRYQIMIRAQQMSKLSRKLRDLLGAMVLPDEVTMSVDVDPVNLS